jgi:hypothetical protein
MSILVRGPSMSLYLAKCALNWLRSPHLFHFRLFYDHEATTKKKKGIQGVGQTGSVQNLCFWSENIFKLPFAAGFLRKSRKSIKALNVLGMMLEMCRSRIRLNKTKPDVTSLNYKPIWSASRSEFRLLKLMPQHFGLYCCQKVVKIQHWENQFLRAFGAEQPLNNSRFRRPH